MFIFKDNYYNKLKSGFTLAEVLITLSIIGIVAALTMPLLIANHKKKVYSVRLKHFYSMMSQAVKLSEVDNGEITGWKTAPAPRDDNGDLIHENRVLSGTEFAGNYILPYIKYTKAQVQSIFFFTQNDNYTVYMPDGSYFAVLNGGDGCVDIYYDINADKKPNVVGKDQFNFLICTKKNQSNNIGFDTYRLSVTNRTSAKSYCKTDPAYCSSLLQYDNWKFKSDYPYKL